VHLANTNQTTTASGAGGFQFTGVPLTLGANNLSISATDLAGNTNTVNQTFTLSNDTSAPAVNAHLANDTGASSSDKITSNAPIPGSISDASNITVFKAGFDGTSVANFVSILGDVSAGNFTLSPARLQQINGNVALVDGNRTLHFFASDVLGNSATTDFA